MDSILITGGTGSFGQAFTKHLLGNTELERICIYSRGEHTQALMRAAFNDDPRLRWFIGDVRDQARLQRAMTGVDVVIHAAALKRIEVGNYNPDEMVKTNVLGAMNVIDAAVAAGVDRVVMLSTDKAYQPISPYGQSKALAESLFLAANTTTGWKHPKFTVVRYGNIAGAQGSVIPKWREMFAKPSLVSFAHITDPECTRFWMTIQEAVDFVMMAMEAEDYNRIHIPELPAYRLGDLVMAMRGIDRYHITGLPEWEKLHECMEDGNCSNTARRMSVAELREALKNV